MWDCVKGEPQRDAYLSDCQYFIDSCPKLHDENSVEYEDIFFNIEAQVQITKIYKHIFEINAKQEQEDTQLDNNEDNNID